MDVSVVESKRHTKRVLDAVERGESVTITYRGKPRAILEPLRREKVRSSIRGYPAFGMWRDRENMRDVAAYVRNLRRDRFERG